MLEFEINDFGGSANLPRGTAPDDFAQKYALEKGISLEEAKAELEKLYGKPQQPNSVYECDQSNLPKGNINNVFTYSMNTYFKCPNTPQEIESFTPDQLASFVRYGAEETGMSERDFAQWVGLPDKVKPDANEEIQKLRDLDIPDDVIQKGDRAIREYAEQNNINIPPKIRK